MNLVFLYLFFPIPGLFPPCCLPNLKSAFENGLQDFPKCQFFISILPENFFSFPLFFSSLSGAVIRGCKGNGFFLSGKCSFDFFYLFSTLPFPFPSMPFQNVSLFVLAAAKVMLVFNFPSPFKKFFILFSGPFLVFFPALNLPLEAAAKVKLVFKFPNLFEKFCIFIFKPLVFSFFHLHRL